MARARVCECLCLRACVCVCAALIETHKVMEICLFDLSLSLSLSLSRSPFSLLLRTLPLLRPARFLLPPAALLQTLRPHTHTNTLSLSLSRPLSLALPLSLSLSLSLSPPSTAPPSRPRETHRPVKGLPGDLVHARRRLQLWLDGSRAALCGERHGTGGTALQARMERQLRYSPLADHTDGQRDGGRWRQGGREKQQSITRRSVR